MQSVLMLLKCSYCQSANRMIVSERNYTPPRCGKCKQPLFERFAVIFGYVYVLSNPAMPNLLKIGHTTGRLQDRVRILSSGTGISRPFVLEAFFMSEHPKEDETRVHSELAEERAPGREFFALRLPDALTRCEKTLGKKPQYVRSVHGKDFQEP